MVGMLVTAQSKCDIRPITIHKGACGTLDVVKSSRKQHVLQLSGKKIILEQVQRGNKIIMVV